MISASTLIGFAESGAFVAVCMWAKPKTELRLWALLLAGIAMHIAGFVDGASQAQQRPERDSPILLDPNMPR